MSQYIKWFNELGMGDVDLVGGKNACNLLPCHGCPDERPHEE